MNPRAPEASSPLAVGRYSARRLALDFGGLGIDLLVVNRLEDHVDAEALLRDANAPAPPYWAHLWTGSRALARLMATQIECAGRRVIDVGCGLGLAGIVAAKRGAAVTLTDAALDAVRFARANAELNGCRVAVLQTDLRCAGVRGRFDYCLAADVTYDPALQVGVAAFLAERLAPGGRAWCSESVRTSDEGFRRACEGHGLAVTEREAREVEDGRDVWVRITEVCRA